MLNLGSSSWFRPREWCGGSAKTKRLTYSRPSILGTAALKIKNPSVQPQAQYLHLEQQKKRRQVSNFQFSWCSRQPELSFPSSHTSAHFFEKCFIPMCAIKTLNYPFSVNLASWVVFWARPPCTALHCTVSSHRWTWLAANNVSYLGTKNLLTESDGNFNTSFLHGHWLMFRHLWHPLTDSY